MIRGRTEKDTKMENIIRENLTVTNNVVIADTTVLKRGKCTCLQSKAYSFSLEEYFRRIKGDNVSKNSLRYSIGYF